MPSTRLIVRGAPLPVSFQGDLNKLWSAMLDRLEVISPFGEVQIQIGGLQPTSNKGPWLKDGTQWYVWDETTKTYIPLDISASLAPVTAAIAAAVTGFATTAAVNAAIAAAVAALPPIPTSLGAHFAVAQTVDMLSPAMTNSECTVDIPFNTVEIDSETGFAAGAYTVKKAGFYSITYVLHTEQAEGTVTGLATVLWIAINGARVRAATYGVVNTGSTIWEINHQAQLAVGDKITASVDFRGDPATALKMRIVSNNTRLSGFLTP